MDHLQLKVEVISDPVRGVRSIWLNRPDGRCVVFGDAHYGPTFADTEQRAPLIEISYEFVPHVVDILEQVTAALRAAM